MSANNQKRVLFVDDELDITTIMRLGLRKFGFDVDTFNDPRITLSQYRPDYYDVIIIDVRMPRMNGFELAKAIWVRDENARICFLAAFEIYENEAKKVFVGFKTHCFIKKPVMPAELAKHIEAHLLTAT